MTYHPVTREELDMIKNDCAYPEKPYCEGCAYFDEDEDITRASGFGCQFKGANALMDEVLARTDPLEVLEKWRFYNEHNGCASIAYHWRKETAFIKELRTKPDVVIARGKVEGWYP